MTNRIIRSSHEHKWEDQTRPPIKFLSHGRRHGFFFFFFLTKLVDFERVETRARGGGGVAVEGGSGSGGGSAKMS